MDIEANGVVGMRPFATGPVATIYAGRAVNGAEVAVKVFGGSLDRDTSAWLGRERAALDRVRSVRAILPIDEVVTTADGRAGVRMELCQGSLAGRLGAGGAAQALPDVLAIGTAVATALAAAHQVGVVHGGVTPDNVLYRRSGEIVLADFGLALRERFPRDPMHAVEYTAPETLRDDVRSVRSDLYGLGAMLYTALTGSPPFPHRTGMSRGERILRVLREQVPPLHGPEVPDELSTVVASLLAKDPAARPADAADVAALLGSLSSAVTGVPPARPAVPAGEPGPGAPDPAPPPPERRTLVLTTGGPPPERAARPRNRVRPGLLTGVGVLVAAVIAVPVLLTRNGNEPSAPPPAVPAAPGPGAPDAPPPAGPQDIRLELSSVDDRGDHVNLTWRAEGDLDFAVVVAGERIDTMVLTAHRRRELRVPVDPVRGYCFQVRATDSRQVYSTEPHAIRGARCKL